MQITAYRAGHVLGAAMFMVEVAGMRCLYTGDYSREADRHMPPADLPELKPDIGQPRQLALAAAGVQACAASVQVHCGAAACKAAMLQAVQH